MDTLDTLPDPDDPDWDDQVRDFVKGTGVSADLGERLVRDAARVRNGDLRLETFGGRYPTRAVEALGIDEQLSVDSEDEREMPIHYSQPTSRNKSASSSETTGAERPTTNGVGHSSGSSCGCGGPESCSCGCGNDGACGCSGATDTRESVLDREFTPEEALAREVPEDLFPDLSETTAMEDLGHGWDMNDIDDEWEANARADLDDVEYDTELGVEMARDALKIAQGELSEAEFHDRYNGAVLDEFGIDHRPTRHAPSPDEAVPDGTEGGDAPDRPLPSVPGEDGVPAASRRRFLKGATAAAAGSAAALAGCLGTDVAPQGTDPGDADGDVQMGMAIDLEQCIGCLLCAEGCMEENNTDLAAFWMHVFRYEEDEQGDVRENYMPRPCQHCSDPSCSYVCPTQARYKRDEDGIVLTNYDTCIGCKYCQVACPYGVNYLGKDDPSDKSPGFWHPTEGDDGIETGGPPPEGVMGKCTFCVHRQDERASRGTTACEDACPVDAIHFGDMEDPDSDPRRHMRSKRDAARFDLLENTGNEPNIVYIGDEPSGTAETTDGPYTYRDLSMVPLTEPADGDGGESD